MPIDFPTPSYIGEPYTYNNKTWEWNGQAWIVVSATQTAISRYVYAVNGITGEVDVTSGTGISISQSGKTLTITNTGTSTPGGISGDYVKFINGLTGGITFFAGTGMSLNFSSAGITFLSTIPSIANTFTQLQSFNAGISASGATMTTLTVGVIEGVTGGNPLEISSYYDILLKGAVSIYDYANPLDYSFLTYKSLIFGNETAGNTATIGNNGPLLIGNATKAGYLTPYILISTSNRIDIDATNVYIPNLRNHVKTINGLSGGITLAGTNEITISSSANGITFDLVLVDGGVY